MTETIENKRNPNRFSLNSIRFKIAAILIAIAICMAGIGFKVADVFGSVSDNMHALSEEQLPEISLSSEIATLANSKRSKMIDITVANDIATLEELDKHITETDSTMSELFTKLPEDEQGVFAESLFKASSALIDFSEAKKGQLRSEEQIADFIAQLQDAGDEMQVLMMDLALDAYHSLVDGSENTISDVDQSLSHLINSEFVITQSLLSIRAEINLLASTAISKGLTTDPDLIAKMDSLTFRSLMNLGVQATILDNMDTSDLLDVSVITSAKDRLESIINQSTFPSEVTRQAALQARETADQALSNAITEMSQRLLKSRNLTSEENRKAIEGLLQKEVSFLNRLLIINNAVAAYQTGVMGVVSARTEAEVAKAEVTMNSSFDTIDRKTLFRFHELDDIKSTLRKLGNSETGIVAVKRAYLKAHENLEDAGRTAANEVQAIVDLAEQRSELSRAEIASMASAMSDNIAQVSTQMIWLAGIALVMFIVSFVLSQFWIVWPLNRISASTQRLAEGDRQPIVGFDKASVEIFKIADALSIFRDGLVEKENLTLIAEKEREERQAAQTAAVAALGDGMSRLAKGDLTTPIDLELAEGYEQLRLDFNDTLDVLNSTIAKVVSAAVSMQGGSAGISQSAEDLSQRTESQAATLEQTAAALDELSASVTSAADGARNVEQTVADARDEAHASGQVVQSAVVAMTEIEQSSNHISQIIGVIDDIAFQTNLLALNAGVEAARAGEAGRGFAVVASEVRALAQRSSEAAMEIKNLISSSATQVGKGVELVDKAGEALQSIMDRVNHISQLVSDIARGAEEQSIGLQEINTGVIQLDQVTQQNAAMVQQATSASQSLTGDASMLTNMVSRFRTTPVDNPTTEAATPGKRAG